MPLYTYLCESCHATNTQIKRVAERDAPCSEPCPDCGQSNCVTRPIETTNGIVSGIQGITHNTSQDFRDVMNQIHKNNKGSRMKG